MNGVVVGPSGETVEVMLRNVSIGGAFVVCDLRPPYGGQVSLSVQLPPSDARVSIPARVQWLNSEGFGVQFGLLGAKETRAIIEFMRSEE